MHKRVASGKKLRLAKETLRALSSVETAMVVGGGSAPGNGDTGATTIVDTQQDSCSCPPTRIATNLCPETGEECTKHIAWRPF